ncbi:MAG: hypothetical protein JWR05_3508 [Mucilaginibacter sp.]|nr:hypothetical protein [Mucilaginibacter sp.]
MNQQSTPSHVKYKRGALYLHNGEEVFINTSNRSDGKISVSTDSTFRNLKTFRLVSPSDLTTTSAKPQNGIIGKIKSKLNCAKPGDKDLNIFYDQMAEIMPFHCQNCGKPLYAGNKFFKRCVSAHILPKSKFETIATNPDNILFLGWGIIGVCYCHDNYDNKGASDRAAMPCYPLVLERFELLKPHIPENQLNEAMKYLNIKP